MVKFFRSISILAAVIFLTSSFAQAETVKIIAEDDWYPYSAKFAEGPKGIVVDIVRAAFKAQGVDVEYDVMNYDKCMELVKDGGAIGCFDAPRTAEIEDVYLWHDERILPAEDYFYAPTDFQGKITSLQDAAGKKVGLTQGYGYGNNVDLDKGMDKEYSKTDTILIRKLLAKRLDSIILFDKVAEYLFPKLSVQGQLKQVGLADKIDIYVAFSKKNSEGKKYRDIFSEGFKKIKADGSYQKIVDEWTTKLKATPAETTPTA